MIFEPVQYEFSDSENIAERPPEDYDSSSP